MEDESLSGIQAEEVVTPQESDDAVEQSSEGEQSSGDADRGQQSHEDNKRYQAARKSGEEAGYQRAMREINERIAKGRMRDPNTGEEIDSIDKLEGYTKTVRENRIQARAKAEGKSVAQVTEEEDTRDWISEQRRKSKAQETGSDFIAKDLANFQARHPEADIAKLDNNASFRRFCGSRYGREPLADLYEDYLEIAGAQGAAALARAESKANRGTGSGGGSGSETLTASQQRALDEWNRNYPNMKMTAKEFLSRG